jgi:hypothetical protein
MLGRLGRSTFPSAPWRGLTVRIAGLLGSPEPLSPAWLAYLHEAVDELDELEPPFAR